MFLPLTARALGLEAFGLVGIAATIQAIVFIVDGCNIMTRLVARGAVSDDGPPSAVLVRIMESVYLRWVTTCALLAAALAWILTRRLQDHANLAMDVTSQAAALIALGAGAKLMASFYRGCVVGFEKFNHANTVALLCYGIRFPVAYLAVTWEPDVRAFLGIQLLSFVLEAILLRLGLGRRSTLEGWRGSAQETAEGKSFLRSQCSFIFGAFILGAVGTFSLQIDKLVLASSLPLADFGAASVAIVMCSGIMVLATPIHQFFLPRMSVASARSDAAPDPLPRLLSTLAAISLPAGATFAIGAPWIALLLAPSAEGGTSALTESLVFYGLGNTVAALSSALFMEYFAAGHVIRYRTIALGYLAIYIPLLILASRHFGLNGAGSVWVVGNVGLFITLALDLQRWRSRSNIELNRVLLGLSVLALGFGAVAPFVHADASVSVIDAIVRISCVYIAGALFSISIIWLTWKLPRERNKARL